MLYRRGADTLRTALRSMQDVENAETVKADSTRLNGTPLPYGRGSDGETAHVLTGTRLEDFAGIELHSGFCKLRSHDGQHD